LARRLWFVASVGIFLIGAGSFALTAWLWFGEWPREAKETADHFRSLAKHAGRPPEPLIGNVRERRTRSLNGSWQAVIDPSDRGALGGQAPRAMKPELPADHGDDDVPTATTDWLNYGGLTRDVTLVCLPTTFVRN
jgi:hypothetical protein